MRSIFFLLDSALYGNEKACVLLNAAAVSIKMDVTLALGLLIPWSGKTRSKWSK
jgi:hypothetical protein